MQVRMSGRGSPTRSAARRAGLQHSEGWNTRRAGAALTLALREGQRLLAGFGHGPAEQPWGRARVSGQTVLYAALSVPHGMCVSRCR